MWKLSTCPTLLITSKLVLKHLPLSISTTNGHLWQDRQYIRYTKPVLTTLIPDTSSLSEHNPNIEPQVHSNRLFINAITVTGKISTDQTVRFPVTPSRGSEYLMVLHDHNRNTILCEPLKYGSGKNSYGPIPTCTSISLTVASAQFSICLTTSVPPVWKSSCTAKVSTSNLWHPIIIVPMPPNTQYKPTRTTLSLASSAVTQIYCYTSGIASSHKQPWP